MVPVGAKTKAGTQFHHGFQAGLKKVLISGAIGRNYILFPFSSSKYKTKKIELDYSTNIII